jgi:hypothetical protein
VIQGTLYSYHICWKVVILTYIPFHYLHYTVLLVYVTNKTILYLITQTPLRHIAPPLFILEIDVVHDHSYTLALSVLWSFFYLVILPAEFFIQVTGPNKFK